MDKITMTMKEHMEMMTRIRRGQEPFAEKVKPNIKRHVKKQN